MKSVFVLAFLGLVVYAPKVHGDLLKTYEQSSFSWASTEKEESKGGSKHLFRLRLVTANEDLLDSADPIPYSCGDQYQIQLEPLNVVETFGGFLVCAYPKTTYDHTNVGAFFQSTTTADWKTTTCYSTNDCATNATGSQQHSELLTWVAPCENAVISFWYTVTDSASQVHGPMYSLTLIPRTTNENQGISRIRRDTADGALEEGLDYLPFLEIEGVTVNITRRDACSNAISISTGLNFGGRRFTDLNICENGIISVGSSSLDVSSSDDISPFPMIGSEARLIAPFWSDVDVVETVNGEIAYQILTEGSDSDQLDLVSQFISHQYRSGVTFTGKWMIVVEWNRVLPHSQPPGSDQKTNTYQAIIITDGGLAFAVFTYKNDSLQWFNALLFSAYRSIVGINDGDGCCESTIIDNMERLSEFACMNCVLEVGWSNRFYLLTTQNQVPPIVLAETIRESALSGDNVTLYFVISAYPRVDESSISLRFQQDNSGTITEVSCGEDIQMSGRSPIGEVYCTRNNSRVFVTLSEVTLEAAGRYSLRAGNELGNGVNFTDLTVHAFDVTACGDFCDIARIGNPEAQAALLADTTENTAEIDAGEIAVVSVLLGNLTAEAANNTLVRASYLQIIDNLLQADPDIVLESQSQNQSSSRVLYSLEDFVSLVQLTNNSANETFAQTRYAFQLYDIPDPNEFSGQDFSVSLGTAQEARNTSITMEINPMSLTSNLNETATAYVQVPGTLFQGQNQPRLAFFVFLQDSFFQETVENVTVGSIVLGVTVSTEAQAEVDTALKMGFRFIKDNVTVPSCSRFYPEGNDGLGVWSNESCRMVRCRPDSDDLEDLVCCECNQTSSQSRSRRQSPNQETYRIGHFGLLLSPEISVLPPEFQLTLAIFSIIGAALSLLCLTLLVLTYLASGKLRTTTHGRLLINVSVSLMGLYVFFIIGGPVSGISVVCEINSALLHYFMLVYFGWTAAEAINLYVKLVKVLGEIRFLSRHFVLKAGLIIWLVPVVIVAISAGAGYMFYFNNYFCRPFEWPFWFGLILPVGIIFIFDWIMFFVIMRALYKHTKEDRKLGKGEKDNSADDIKKISRYSIVLATLFGLGWTFGLLATQYGDQNHLSFILSLFFCLIVGCQGILLLYFHGVRSPDAIVVWNRWYLKCCPCCPCGKGRKKTKFSFKKPAARKEANINEPSAKDTTLGRSQLVESLPTLVDSLTTSDRTPRLSSPRHGPVPESLLTSPQSQASWDSRSLEMKGFAVSSLSEGTSWSVDEDGDKRDMVEWF